MPEPGMLPFVAAKRWILPLCLLLLPACADDGDGDGDGDELAVDQVCETALEECMMCDPELEAWADCANDEECKAGDDFAALVDAKNACLQACLAPIYELELYAVGDDGTEWGASLEQRAWGMVENCTRFPELCMENVQGCEDGEAGYLEAIAD